MNQSVTHGFIWTNNIHVHLTFRAFTLTVTNRSEGIGTYLSGFFGVVHKALSLHFNFSITLQSEMAWRQSAGTHGLHFLLNEMRRGHLNKQISYSTNTNDQWPVKTFASCLDLKFRRQPRAELWRSYIILFVFILMCFLWAPPFINLDTQTSNCSSTDFVVVGFF